MRLIRAGMIGTGYMAQKHLAAIGNHPRLSWVGLVHTARSAEIAEAMRTRYGFDFATTDVGALLEADVDLVYVCSPNSAHYQQVVAAVEAGKHVLCEKPLASRADEAVDLVRRVRASRSKVAVGMNVRFRSPFAETSVLCRSGRLGRIQYVRGRYIMNFEAAVKAGTKAWWRSEPGEVFPLVTGGIHCIDVLTWIAGDVEEVYARADGPALMEGWKGDTFHLSMRFTGGASGDLLVACGAVRPDEMAVEAYGKAGSVIGDRWFWRGAAGLLHEERIEGDQPPEDLQRQLDDLLAAIDKDEQPLNTVENSARELIACEGALRSIETGGVVRVDYSALDG